MGRSDEMKRLILVLEIALVAPACSPSSGGSSPEAGQPPAGSAAAAPAATPAVPAPGPHASSRATHSSASSPEAPAARTAPASTAPPKHRFKEVTVPSGTA